MLINNINLLDSVEEEDEVFVSPEINFDLIPTSPYHENAISDDQKIQMISYHFQKILETIGLDVTDDSINKTPYRYAKMLIKELFVGLKENNFPKITTQENNFHYNQMLIKSNISI